MSELHGVINVYKEKGYTSHDVVAILKKTLGQKCGHTGTLDPNAEGVLPICVGKATKLSDFIMGGTKRYTATVILGVKTDTQDMTGEVIEKKDVNVSRKEIIEAVKSFGGDIMQMPPMYSAIKVNGRKLYEIARSGVTIDRKARPVTICDINILDFLQGNMFIIDVKCSKGTYIRSLCYDIGEKLGCGAHMGDLLRTQSGCFSITQSYKLNEIKTLFQNGNIRHFLIPMDEVLNGYGKLSVCGKTEALLKNGNHIPADEFNINEKENILVYGGDSSLIGIFTNEENRLRPVKMLI